MRHSGSLTKALTTSAHWNTVIVWSHYGWFGFHLIAVIEVCRPSIFLWCYIKTETAWQTNSVYGIHKLDSSFWLMLCHKTPYAKKNKYRPFVYTTFGVVFSRILPPGTMLDLSCQHVKVKIWVGRSRLLTRCSGRPGGIMSVQMPRGKVRVMHTL